ncbi:AtpZ/AtpI family protein [Candidatus Gottesmanbacteria bacterium]|nr:AtpZ/AtpI family protein [Candidatus Gottesmanbacteria bacterium]
MKVNKKRRSASPYDTWWYVSLVGQVGLVVTVPMVAGVFIGRFVDNQLMSPPIATLVFLLVGIIVSLFNLVQLIQQILAR